MKKISLDGGVPRTVINKYRYNINDIIENAKSGKLKILKQIRVGSSNAKAYEYECLVCSNVDKIRESDIKRKQGCNVCANKKIKIGINDIHTTHPELGKLFWNYEDGYTLLSQSNKKADFKCQNCGERIKDKRIYHIFNQHLKLNKALPCNSCSHGKTIPNKFIYNIFKQITSDVKTEYSPDWAEGARYDISSKLLNCTIEMHGVQHYKQTGRKGARTLAEEQENDRIKEKSHVENSQRHYIIIDSRVSEMKYIRQNILSSKLAEIIDFNLIDFKKAWEDSQCSTIKDSWDLWNSGECDVAEIAELVGASKSSIRTYLKRGAILGKCDYDAKEIRKENAVRAGKTRCKPLARLTLNGGYIDGYESAAEAERQLSINNSDILAACKGKRISAGGFKWMYKEDYESVMEVRELAELVGLGVNWNSKTKTVELYRK